MINHLVIVFLVFCFVLPDHITLADDHHLSFSVRTELKNPDFPLILGNKKWDSGEVIDLTSHHNLGLTRSSGKLKGWSIVLQPSGSWAWNIGTGEARLDYMPTAARQPINDGAWHDVAFSFIEKERIIRLFYDGQMVSVYSLDDLHEEDLYSLFEAKLKVNKSQFDVKNISNDPQDHRIALTTPTQQSRVDEIKLLCWNIWHGGRRDGNTRGLQTTIGIIKESAADIICMQETYGSGPVIADSLGYIFYYRSSNLSIHTRYPIIDTHGEGDPFRIGGVTLRLSDEQQIRVFSLWINSSPNVDVTIPNAMDADTLITLENTTRVKEINEILSKIRPLGKSIPIIVAGDFNSPSHLDWTEGTSNWHRGLIVEWPVSKSMIKAGYSDAFRDVYPEPTSNYGRTWSPRFISSACHERIDHIYHQGGSLRPVQAAMLDRNSIQWPSDHAAVLVSFTLR